jgi:cystathionine gamma-synthase
MADPAISLPILNGDSSDQDKKDHTPQEALQSLSISSKAIHADDFLNANNHDVAPPLHVSTTFRYPHDPEALIPSHLADVRHLHFSTDPPATSH